MNIVYTLPLACLVGGIAWRFKDGLPPVAEDGALSAPERHGEVRRGEPQRPGLSPGGAHDAVPIDLVEASAHEVLKFPRAVRIHGMRGELTFRQVVPEYI